MTHTRNSLFDVSIDRIDSSKGHVRGNIQLVCKFINLGKGTHTNEDTLLMLSAIKLAK